MKNGKEKPKIKEPDGLTRRSFAALLGSGLGLVVAGPGKAKPAAAVSCHEAAYYCRLDEEGKRK